MTDPNFNTAATNDPGDVNPLAASPLESGSPHSGAHPAPHEAGPSPFDSASADNTKHNNINNDRPAPPPPPNVVVEKEYDWDGEAAFEMIERSDMDVYEHKFGTVAGICETLKSDIRDGISTTSLASRYAQFGKNELTHKDPVTFWEMVVDALGDEVIQILIIAAVISIIFGLSLPNPHSGEIEFETGWIEGTAILISAIVVVTVGAVNNYEKAKKFEELERQTAVKKVTVTRDGKDETIMSDDIVVGDLLHLEPGMEIPCDGIYASGNLLKHNESPITGEPDLIDKDPEHPFVISGTAVEDGSGKMIVIAIGMDSFQGRMKDMKDDEKKSSPKQSSPGGAGAGEGGGGDGDKADASEVACEGEEEGAEEKEPIVDGCCVCCINTCPGWCIRSRCCMTKEMIEIAEAEGDDADQTPLQKHLADLADAIGKWGLRGALLLILSLMLKEVILIGAYDKTAHATNFLTFIIVGVTIVAVAIPEGLPLAVTIALAFSMKSMMDDNCMVRVLASCETMGAATAICSDKTGTLTTNQMTVVQGYTCEQEWLLDEYELAPRDPAVVKVCDRSKPLLDLPDMPDHCKELVARSLSLNSTARKQQNKETGEEEWAGNKTEIGLLGTCTLLGFDFMKFRDEVAEGASLQYNFNSRKKKMTTLVREFSSSPTCEAPFSSPATSPSTSAASAAAGAGGGGKIVAHIKGASEIVFASCNRIVRRDGSVSEIDINTRAFVDDVIEDMAKQGNRTIALAYTDCDFTEFPKEQPDFENMIFLGVLGIQDPIRPEVPAAVQRCGSAGLVVRMVTGDNINTAKAIGKKCSLYNENTDLAIEGPRFRELYRNDEDKLREMLPKIRIIARSSPKDKFILVKMLQDPMGLCDVVGVTGDGTNDAPALKLADVGFAMATGTDIAKGSADMVLLDDNFATVVTAIKWGRSVNDNIKKYLQYQLAINFAGVALTVVGSLASESSKEPLSPVQLLWLNLIMDTLAALSLATERPEDACLDREPVYKVAPLITNRMWTFIGVHGGYQFVLTLLILFLGHDWFNTIDGAWECDKAGIDKSKFANGTYVASLMRWCSHECKSVGGLFFEDSMRCQQGNVHSTMIFNTFIWFQVFNVINARKIYSECNPLEGTWDRSKPLIIIFIFVIALQCVAVEFFGRFMHTTHLPWHLWLICIGFGAIEIFVGIFCRALPVTDFIPDTAAEKVARERERSAEIVRETARIKAERELASKRGADGGVASYPTSPRGDPSLRRSQSIRKRRHSSFALPVDSPLPGETVTSGTAASNNDDFGPVVG